MCREKKKKEAQQTYRLKIKSYALICSETNLKIDMFWY